MSKIVQYAGLIFLCGQTANGSTSERDGIQDQVKETLSRVDALLHEVGSTRADLLSATLYLRRIEDFNAMNEIWESWLPPAAAPARTTVQAALGSENLLFEVTVIAATRQHVSLPI